MLAHPCGTHQGDVGAEGLQQGHDKLRIWGVASHKNGQRLVLGTSVATYRATAQRCVCLRVPVCVAL